MAVGAVIAPSFAFAQTNNEQTKAGTSVQSKFTRKAMHSNAKGIHGTVVSISGSIITLTNKKNVTYTIDATNAKFGSEGIGNTLTLASLLVNDKISVHGTISGTNVTATSISDRSLFERTVFSGKVTAVSGTTITLVNNKTVSYTVNVGSATLKKGFGKNAKTILFSDVVVGDRLTVVGSLSGTTVTATSIDDKGVSVSAAHTFGKNQRKTT